MSDSSGSRLLTALEDMVSNIHIETDFSIRHPNYPSDTLPQEIAARWQEIPPALQQKYLLLRLRNFIYRIYYNGSLQSNIHEASSDFHNLDTHINIDWQFYEQLHTNNHGTGYFDPGWQVLREEPDGSLAVSKGGLTLHIERDLQSGHQPKYRHLQYSESTISPGNFIAVWLPQNRLQNGFYLAISNYGQEQQGSISSEIKIAQIFLNLQPEGAPVIMDNLTREMNDIAIPFTFKVLYNPLAYGCYDSGVLYFENRDYVAVRQVLQEIYRQHRRYFQPEIPLFTKFLAPGLGLAEQPAVKLAYQRNFGIHRCEIIANSLVEAWLGGFNSPAERMAAIEQTFISLGIDLQRPYLNPNSEDIYYLLS
ncbi:MAG: T3SS effector HopA1 family protein [Nostocaceae cyanobacterium]|nr:T3SS effector HopA1 family protein [Nostocaceae cyanobacterium]